MPEERDMEFNSPQSQYGSQYTSAYENDNAYYLGGLRLTNVVNRLSEEDGKTAADILSYIDGGRTAEAVQMAQDIVNRNMSNEVAWLVYAEAKSAWGDRDLARKAFEQAIAINPCFSLALNDYGVFLFADKEYDLARTYYNRALENEPTNSLFMSNVAGILAFTDSFAAAIDKCKYFIELSDDKTRLKDTLGSIYVELSETYLVDVPNDFEDPSEGTEPGFIYLSDINDVREYCLQAKNLLSEENQECLERCNNLLKICDENQYNTFRIRKWPFIIFHTAITVLLYGIISIITYGIFLPVLVIATYANIKGCSFPIYMLNNAYCTGTDDPLKYKEGSVRDAMSKGAVEGLIRSGEYTIGTEMALDFFKSRIWLFRARLSFYKRFIQNMKSKKEDNSNNA